MYSKPRSASLLPSLPPGLSSASIASTAVAQPRLPTNSVLAASAEDERIAVLPISFIHLVNCEDKEASQNNMNKEITKMKN